MMSKNFNFIENLWRSMFPDPITILNLETNEIIKKNNNNNKEKMITTMKYCTYGVMLYYNIRTDYILSKVIENCANKIM
jgi:hypothetical protein